MRMHANASYPEVQGNRIIHRLGPEFGSGN